MSGKKLDYLGVSAFCESMAMMVQAGIQTDEAITLLQSDRTHSSGILEEGLSVMKEMVEAGEHSGRLEDILFRLSRYYADQKTISEKLHNAVTYPAAMLVLIIAVLAVMLVMVLPAFTDVYDNLTGSLAASSYSYVRLAYGFCWFALILMLLLAGGLVAGLLLWKSGKRKKVEAVLRKNPLCASLLESMGMFRFTSALGTFLASGEMQDEAVLNSLPMTDYEPVEEKLKRCVLRMEEGHSIAQAAYDEELFEPVYGRMLLAGERSGSLEHVLGRLTELLEENCGNLAERLVGIIDPLLSGVLMFTVGLSLLSVMLPLIGMMNSIA